MTVIQTVYSIPPAALESLSVHCSACIERLKSHQAEETDMFANHTTCRFGWGSNTIECII